jgi:copper-binding protein NosD
VSSRPSMFVCRAVFGCCAVLLAPPVWARPIACPPGDNATIQGCLDSARPGDDILFSGIYTIDPSQPPVTLENRSSVRLLGDAARPALFQCQVEADGRPLAVNNRNDAFQLLASESRVSGVVFEGLHFEGCGTAILLQVVGAGSFANIEILEIEASNVYYGVLAQAPVDGLAIQGSRISNADRAIVLDETQRGYIFRDVEITGNVLRGLAPSQLAKMSQSGIFLLGALDGKVAGNIVSGVTQTVEIVPLGIAALNFGTAPTNLDIVHNVVTNVGVGISLGGSAPADGSVAGNDVEGAATAGIVIRAGANGHRIGVNRLANNDVDVRLTGVDTAAGDAGSHDNEVLLLCGQTYEDFGVDNRVLVHPR